MPFEIPSFTTMRRAVAQEVEASRRVLSLGVEGARRDGELVQCLLMEGRDLNSLEDGMEGWPATWQNRDRLGRAVRGGGGFVAVANSEERKLALKMVSGELPVMGTVMRLYQPNYMESLEKVWDREDAKGFGDRFVMKLRGGTSGVGLSPKRFDWLRKAQREAFGLTRWPAGFLWGPPGTGKTTTLAAMLAEKLMSEPASRVLVVSTTNPTVDDLLIAVDERLEKLGCKADRLPRAGLKRVGRMFQSAKFASRKHLLPKGDPRVLDELELLEAEPPKKSDAQAYHQWKERCEKLRHKVEGELGQVVRDSRLVAMTTSRALYGFAVLRSGPDLDLVVFEESSQIPLPVAVALGDLGKKMLFGGDPKQLAPICRSAEEPARRLFGVSAFEARDARAGNSVFLDEQSRMAPPICRMISNVFYEGKLRVADDAVNKKEWQRQRAPVPLGKFGAANSYWVEVNGMNRFSPYYGSNVREGTGRVVVEIVQKLLERVPGSEIVVLTPYRGQRQWLANQLRGKVKVSTVHRAQGTECDSIVFDAVNLQNEFLGDLERARRLLNVALSRAKSRLIVVGDTGDLGHPVMKALHGWIEKKSGSEAGKAVSTVPHISTVLEDEGRLRGSLGKVFRFPVDASNPEVEVELVDFVGEKLRFRIQQSGEDQWVKVETVRQRILRQRDRYQEPKQASGKIEERPKGAKARPIGFYVASAEFPENLDDEVVWFQDRGGRGRLECWVKKVERERVQVVIENRNGQIDWFPVSYLREQGLKEVAEEKLRAIEVPQSTGRLALKGALEQPGFPAGMEGKTLLCGKEQGTWLMVVRVEGGRLLVMDEDSRERYYTTGEELRERFGVEKVRAAGGWK